MISLLDVNVMIALIDPAHAFHRTAKKWTLAHASQGWASCPLTQNGCFVSLAKQAIRSLSRFSKPFRPCKAFALSLIHIYLAGPTTHRANDDLDVVA